ncbi:threonine dehydrogenase or related Zn-dependent dehydrogenase [Levilactobacillus paucivorans]|uniref:Threonine dehydrogenase or related Zn-dependent dehydrogenase n=1 Tax=Levilactobacillus paucivorans TaxID=616990 RepID=A0A0R2LR29_9LACO|nr:zinc-binding dehydrogenase [Levilactobacillus paucivorans]KRO04104.1 threonine dehydrogenase or related Zn-dependent dehydrogenase [Levilactobacillus paucivorans]
MKSVYVTGPGKVDWKTIDAPQVGPNDVLLQMKACGICGSDAMYTRIGGIPPRQGATPLGHEPAAEVSQIGANVKGIAVGDHVVVDTLKFTDGLLGSGGAQGGLSDFVLVKYFQPGHQLRVIPKNIPWQVAALNEPMAVAAHAVNQTQPKPGDKVVVFGAGPIGLGALLSYKRKGVASVVVVDIIQSRLDKALEIGADAVINSAKENVGERLVALQGNGASGFMRGVHPATDIYLDAAGATPVFQTVLDIAKHGATLGVVAVYTKPVELNFANVLTSELHVVWSMGYPTEIFEVTDDIIDRPDKYAKIISNTFPFDQALDALKMARTPGAADKVVVTFD